MAYSRRLLEALLSCHKLCAICSFLQTNDRQRYLLALRIEGQGMDGRRMSATVEFHGQFHARFAKIPQWETKGNHGVQFRRASRAADPADFPVSTEEFCPVGRNRLIFQQESHQLAAYVAIGVHPRDNLLAWVTALVAVSYTHLRAHETPEHLVCRLLLEK